MPIAALYPTGLVSCSNSGTPRKKQPEGMSMSTVWKKPGGRIPACLVPITEDVGDYMLVLQSYKPCNKKIDLSDPKNWQVDAYQNHKHFTFWKLPITTFDDLYSDLIEIAATKHFFLVYGAPTDYAIENADKKLLRRMLSGEDQPASIATRSSCVAIGDIDTMILPHLTYDDAGAQRIIDELVKQGLEELEGVRIIYNWTSKAGQKPNVARFRFFALLEQEASLDALRAWANRTALLDLKIYDANQPIYITNPSFINGTPPISQEDRWGILEGEREDMVAIPDAKASDTTKPVPQSADSDYILAHLYEQGKVKKQIAAGKYDVTCPWVHEHSGEKDDGAVLMLPNYNGYTQHAFKCQHEHCKDREFPDFLAALNLKDPSDGFDPDNDFDPENMTLKGLTKRYAYVTDQDKFYDFHSRTLIKQEALNRAWMHHYVRPPAGTALLRRPDLIRADTMTYIPGAAPVTTWKGLTVINLWRKDTTIVPEKGDAKRWVDHLHWLMEKKDAEHFLMWCAYLLQNQQTKINHALLIGGAQRIGKDTLLDPLKRYLGSYNVSEPSAEELKETFTDYLHHKKLVIFQECQNFDKLNVENKLKPMLASPPDTLRVRLFGQGFYETPNLVQCIFMSNHRNALKISKGDGRYYPIWCDPEEPKTATYYTDLYNWLENENGYGKVIHYLLNLDVSKFQHKAPPPTTSYKQLMIDMSGTDLEMALKERIDNHEKPFDKDIILPRAVIEHGGWEGITVKRLVGALDALGGLPRTIKTGKDGSREQKSFWAIRNQSRWKRAASAKWHEHFLGTKTAGTK